MTLLGGITPAEFLRKYWQKRPLLIRQAIPGFSGFVDAAKMCDLAKRSDAASRAVVEHPGRKRDRWDLHEGPFGLDPDAIPKSHFTLVVQGVESLMPGGWELLQKFAFIPAARVDDLQISYAVDGGSVGPHDDRYDVFLLQGPGKRRWRYSEHYDHAVDEAAPLKILRTFKAEKEYLLEPGDMLYLPPGVAHWGVAEGSCFTYSIGFVAPSHDSLVQNFLAYLGQRFAESIDPETLYEDPKLVPAKRQHLLSDDLVAKTTKLLADIRWDRSLVEDYLGRLLTGPKPQTEFHPPSKPLTPAALAARLKKPGTLTFALPTRGLVRGDQLFVNGNRYPLDKKSLATFEQLLASRSLSLPQKFSRSALTTVESLYALGALQIF